MTPLSLGVSCCHREGPPVALRTALQVAAEWVPATVGVGFRGRVIPLHAAMCEGQGLEGRGGLSRAQGNV